MVKKNFCRKLIDTLQKHRLITNYVFLGVGLALFVMNLTAFMSFVKNSPYDYLLFDLSIFSSMLIIIITVYNITAKK